MTLVRTEAALPGRHQRLTPAGSGCRSTAVSKWRYATVLPAERACRIRGDPLVRITRATGVDDELSRGIYS
jgi:hypothetical protein